LLHDSSIGLVSYPGYAPTLGEKRLSFNYYSFFRYNVDTLAKIAH